MICRRIDDPFHELSEVNPGALLADGLEEAYLGYVINTHHKSVAVYDATKCVEVLMQDGMTEEEAEEYLEFNTFCAYVGEDGPLFIRGA
jgi:hypothetical protein